MQVLSEPLHMSLERNRQMLAEAEEQNMKRRVIEGDASGNRHERRLAAKRARLARKHENA